MFLWYTQIDRVSPIRNIHNEIVYIMSTKLIQRDSCYSVNGNTTTSVINYKIKLIRW